MLELSRLDLDEIANALADQMDYEHYWLINPETGEIVYWSRDTGIDGQNPIDLDELDYLEIIRPLPSPVWYQDMVDFTELISDERAGRRLARALQGKGAFRRFRDVLHEDFPHLVKPWYAFRDARGQRHAVEWLVDNSLIDEDEAARFYEEHPDPELPSTSRTALDWTLEVVVLPVSDIDRAIAFYRDKVGFVLDHDTRTEHMHVAQLTPVGSGCSIVVGDLPAQREMAPGSMRGLQLCVPDAKAARQELLDRGVAVSEITVFDERDGGTFFGFADPDGNTWAVQELKARASQPLIPPEYRGRFGEDMTLD
jgi:predicted enzyme related to lactoylglutathione lyase